VGSDDGDVKNLRDLGNKINCSDTDLFVFVCPQWAVILAGWLFELLGIDYFSAAVRGSQTQDDARSEQFALSSTPLRAQSLKYFWDLTPRPRRGRKV